MNGEIFKTIAKNVTLGGIVLILLYMLWNLGANHLGELTSEMKLHRQETQENSRGLNEVLREQVKVLGELKTLIELKIR